MEQEKQDREWYHRPEAISILYMCYLQSFPAFPVLIAGTEAIKEARIGNASGSACHLIVTIVNMLLENIELFCFLLFTVMSWDVKGSVESDHWPAAETHVFEWTQFSIIPKGKVQKNKKEKKTNKC